MRHSIQLGPQCERTSIRKDAPAPKATQNTALACRGSFSAEITAAGRCAPNHIGRYASAPIPHRAHRIISYYNKFGSTCSYFRYLPDFMRLFAPASTVTCSRRARSAARTTHHSRGAKFSINDAKAQSFNATAFVYGTFGQRHRSLLRNQIL